MAHALRLDLRTCHDEVQNWRPAWPERRPDQTATIDTGWSIHLSALPPETDGVLGSFGGTFTRDLHDLAIWCQSYDGTSVAMWSTGEASTPASEILQAHGFAMNLSRRKTDNSDTGGLCLRPALWLVPRKAQNPGSLTPSLLANTVADSDALRHITRPVFHRLPLCPSQILKLG